MVIQGFSNFIFLVYLASWGNAWDLCVFALIEMLSSADAPEPKWIWIRRN